MMETDIGMMQLQAKEHQELPANTKTWEATRKCSPLSLRKEHSPANSLTSDL